LSEKLVGLKEARMPKKVLLVDDSKTALLMETMILKQRTSYDCVTAHDGVEALACALRENPDLVLMDVVMPRLNGFETCKRMRLQDTLRNIPIILVTTRGEEEHVEAGYQCGCNDYLNKPVKGDELVSLLQSYLGE
jgi:DNA-binding response OmpR family regulator